MNETITRRSFLNLKNTSTDRIVHIDPEWPTPEMAKLELDFLESEPFIFKLPIPKEKPKKLNTKTSLNKLSSNNWDLRKAAHLLRRISSGSNYDEIKHFSDIGLNDAIKEIFRVRHKPQIPGEWVYEQIPDFGKLSTAERQEYQKIYRERRIKLIEWWQNLILRDEISIREKMTLFWHDHFATSAETIIYPPAMYHQNRVLRENSLGNFKDLITLMTFDPAMMIWLNNNENSVGSINENFSRELLELFTLGEGNYTEQDVTEAARALTGYFTDGLNIYFAPEKI